MTAASEQLYSRRVRFGESSRDSGRALLGRLFFVPERLPWLHDAPIAHDRCFWPRSKEVPDERQAFLDGGLRRRPGALRGRVARAPARAHEALGKHPFPSDPRPGHACKFAILREGPRSSVTSGRTSFSRRLVKEGWATVYMAEQRQPVRRTVAAEDHQARHGLRRSHCPVRGRAAERFGLMDHPHIAKVWTPGRWCPAVRSS